MVARRKARSSLPAAQAGDLEDLPDYLAAGRCLEVWAPGLPWDHPPPTEAPVVRGWGLPLAMHRWSWARDEWLREQGLSDVHRSQWPRRLHDHRPWSFARHQADGRLAQMLIARGLPSDWTPTPAPAHLLTDQHHA